MISLAFKSITEPNFQQSSLLKLFYTWTEERINVLPLISKYRDTFGRLLFGPDYSEDFKYWSQCVSTVINLIIHKIINIKTNSSKGVKVIDFTGLSVREEELETLLNSKFTKSEKTTIVLCLGAHDNHETSPAKLLRILLGNDHFDFKCDLHKIISFLYIHILLIQCPPLLVW